MFTWATAPTFAVMLLFWLLAAYVVTRSPRGLVPLAAVGAAVAAAAYLLSQGMHESVVRVSIDPTADALYIRLTEADIQDSEEVRPGVILDFGPDGEVVGIEMLHVSTRMKPEDLRSFSFTTS
jgi:uncharacterized protein YuzE